MINSLLDSFPPFHFFQLSVIFTCSFSFRNWWSLQFFLMFPNIFRYNDLNNVFSHCELYLIYFLVFVFCFRFFPLFSLNSFTVNIILGENIATSACLSPISLHCSHNLTFIFLVFTLNVSSLFFNFF